MLQEIRLSSTPFDLLERYRLFRSQTKTAHIATRLDSYKTPPFSSLIGALDNSCTGFVLCFMHQYQCSFMMSRCSEETKEGSSSILLQNLTSISSFDIEKSMLVCLHGRDVIVVRL